MKITYIISLIIFSHFICNAQSNNNSGIIKYDIISISNSAEALLYFNQYESYYISEDKKNEKKDSIKENETNSYNLEIKINKTIYADSPSITFKSIKTQEILSRFQWIDKKTYLLKEKLPKLQWEIKNEKKQISNFKCQKAIVQFRGRKYTAWFTMAIPVSSGPWKLHGLPGMIIEAYDDAKEIWFGAKEISYPQLYKNLNTSILETPNVITIQEYVELRNNMADDYFKKDELKKKLQSQMPRGTTIEVETKTTGNFWEKEFEFEKESK